MYKWAICQGEVLPITEICGDGKDNNCDGKTDEGCCNITTSVSPTDVWPQKAGSDKTTSTIMVSLNKPAPPEGCNVKLTIEPIEQSGGHSHAGSRPKGTITPAALTLPGGIMSAQNATYKSSEVSGEEKIIANVNGEKKAEAKVTVKVPDLHQLSGGALRLTGNERPGPGDRHPANHYGTYSTVVNAGSMAADFYDKFNATLGINDMSLPGGGLFDISGAWVPPHSSHRKGTSVDIDRNAQAQNGGVGVDRNSIDKICKKYGGHLVRESTIHCEFPQ